MGSDLACKLGSWNPRGLLVGLNSVVSSASFFVFFFFPCRLLLYWKLWSELPQASKKAGTMRLRQKLRQFLLCQWQMLMRIIIDYSYKALFSKITYIHSTVQTIWKKTHTFEQTSPFTPNIHADILVTGMHGLHRLVKRPVQRVKSRDGPKPRQSGYTLQAGRPHHEVADQNTAWNYIHTHRQ